MPSIALQNFADRTEEVRQLLEAHSALISIRKAKAALGMDIPGLAAISAAIGHLVTTPGPGRPHQVHALNSAGIALLSGHLQGYISELYAEASRALLTNAVIDINIAIKANDLRGNPNEDNIKRLFQNLGFNDVLAGISWQKMSNSDLRTKLRRFNELRNKIVHGKIWRVKKNEVQDCLNVFTRLAEAMDDKLRSEIHAISGAYPWDAVASI